MSQLIVSLELNNIGEVQRVVEELGNEFTFYKVGLPLFVKEGPLVVSWLHSQKKKVFLDLKFYDIPSVTVRAIERACELGVFMVNFHVLSGSLLLKELQKVKKRYRSTLIVGVTLLTSYSKEHLVEFGLLSAKDTVSERVVGLARRVKDACLDGVVSSVQDVKCIKEECGDDFVLVTPGVRLSREESAFDQSRSATVHEARCVGSDYVVVGRSIINSKNKRATALEYLSHLL